jgi:putative protease
VENATGDIVQQYQPEPTLGIGAPTDQVFLLQEANRPDEQMPAFEDEHGTYIMNAKDLRAVQHVERLTHMGVHSLKIEGRTKSTSTARAPPRCTARRSTTRWPVANLTAT